MAFDKKEVGIMVTILFLLCIIEAIGCFERRKYIISESHRAFTQAILKEKEHCDLVVCLSHLGWQIDGVDDSEVIPATQGIDLVLGGHSHTYMERPEVVKNAAGKNVYCNQMGKHGRYVGELLLQMEPTEN